MTLLETLPSATLSWSEFCAEHAPETGALAGLSPAERVVVAHLQLGLSNREIARRLGKSEMTVKNQVSSCLRKVGVPSRMRLIALLR